MDEGRTLRGERSLSGKQSAHPSAALGCLERSLAGKGQCHSRPACDGAVGASAGALGRGRPGPPPGDLRTVARGGYSANGDQVQPRGDRVEAAPLTWVRHWTLPGLGVSRRCVFAALARASSIKRALSTRFNKGPQVRILNSEDSISRKSEPVIDPGALVRIVLATAP